METVHQKKVKFPLESFKTRMFEDKFLLLKMPLKCHRIACYAVRGLTLENGSPDASCYCAQARTGTIIDSYILSKISGDELARI